jgi:tRNA(fMet)-specific endonuclease VapC
MAYLIDTDWAVNLLVGRNPALAETRRLGMAQMSVSRVSAAELYHGAFATPSPEGHLIAIRHFLDSCQMIELSDPICERFGEIRSALWRRGEKLSDFDLVIAATALSHDLTLLTFNRRHFERVPGLRLYAR